METQNGSHQSEEEDIDRNPCEVSEFSEKPCVQFFRTVIFSDDLHAGNYSNILVAPEGNLFNRLNLLSDK